MTIRVGITGQSGFIGKHLCFYLQTREKDENIQIVNFSRDYFMDKAQLSDFASQCDCIVHLAAMNRGDPDEIYESNVRLVKDLIEVLESKNHSPHIIFSSSVQEKSDSIYGASKREGRRLFEEWSSRTGGKFTGLVIPNVFGAFGRPFYNSVVATFCHQVAHGEEPEIKIDAMLNLVYVNDLAAYIYRIILAGDVDAVELYPLNDFKVSDVLEKLSGFRDSYMVSHTIPELNNHFDISLFNSFRTYIDHDYYPMPLELHSDQRGWLFEMIRSGSGGQSFFSMTKPGAVRGNHFHTRKIERFCVVQGEASVKLRRIDIDDIIEYPVSGSKPCFIDIPIFHTHNITNTGSKELLTMFWSNEIYNPDDADTWFKEV